MTQYNKRNLMLLGSQFDKLKSGNKNNMEVILRLLSNRLLLMKLIFHINNY